MLWLTIPGLVAFAVVLIVGVNECAVWLRCRRRAKRMQPVVDVLLLDWDEPEGRKRLGRLGQ